MLLAIVLALVVVAAIAYAVLTRHTRYFRTFSSEAEWLAHESGGNEGSTPRAPVKAPHEQAPTIPVVQAQSFM